MTAFITAGRAPTVPASPAPFTPRGFNFVGTGLLPTSPDRIEYAPAIRSA